MEISITFLLLLLSSSLIFLVLLIKLAWNKDKNLGRMIGKLLQQLMTSFTLINKKYYGLGQVTASVVVISSTKEALRTNDSSTDGSTDDSSGLPNTNMEMMMGLGPSSDLNQQNFPPETASEDRQWGQMSFSLDQPQFSTPEASNSNPDSSTAYDPEIQQQHTAYHNQPILMMNCPYPAELMPKYPHFHFTNNTPLWINASAPPATIANAQASFIPALQTQIPTAPFFDDNKPKVRKLAKLGDRITALHQLVSPFGKSDTASVLSEAIGYIKFLHGQVGALTDPCMKNGAPIQNQQKSDKSQDIEDGSCQDLRSRGLCLVPVSSTFPVIHETEAYFWTPTFG